MSSALAEQGIYDDFGYFSAYGTSFAAPAVSARAALLISHGITDPAAVKAAIASSAGERPKAKGKT